mmetsp:Transcript_63251/g.159508  ORF Transcript_63251/g.159508 Transcript_63251/m.159508 type:complete len:221 (+) Transcript_63251:474-1136(+)
MAAVLQEVALRFPLDTIVTCRGEFFDEFLQERRWCCWGRIDRPWGGRCRRKGWGRCASVWCEVLRQGRHLRARAYFKHASREGQEDGRVEIKLLRQVRPQELHAAAALHGVDDGVLVDGLQVVDEEHLLPGERPPNETLTDEELELRAAIRVEAVQALGLHCIETPLGVVVSLVGDEITAQLPLDAVAAPRSEIVHKVLQGGLGSKGGRHGRKIHRHRGR